MIIKLCTALITKNNNKIVNILAYIIPYWVGKRMFLEIVEILSISFFEANKIIQVLVEQKLLKRVE